MKAAAGGHTEILQLLIEAGASLELEDKYKRTALLHAAKADKRGSTALLIDKGASLNFLANDKELASRCESLVDSTEIAELLTATFYVNLYIDDDY